MQVALSCLSWAVRWDSSLGLVNLGAGKPTRSSFHHSLFFCTELVLSGFDLRGFFSGAVKVPGVFFGDSGDWSKGPSHGMTFGEPTEKTTFTTKWEQLPIFLGGGRQEH